MESNEIEDLGKYHLRFPPEIPILLTGRFSDEEYPYQVLEYPENADTANLFDNLNIETLSPERVKVLQEIYIGQQSPSLVKAISDKRTALKSLLEKFHNWDLLMLQNYSGLLDLEAISSNNNILWSKDKILALEFTEVQKNKIFQYGRFEDIDRLLLEGEFVNWSFICMNDNVKWTISLLHIHKERINWENLVWRPSFIWQEKDIEIFSPFFKNWRSISGTPNVHWTIELIEKFQNNLDWYTLSKNSSIPWNLKTLEKFQWTMNFRELSANVGAFWSTEIIESFESRWDWKELSKNEAMCWNEKLIRKYVRKLDRERLVVNPGIDWSAEMLTEFSDWLEAPTVNYGNGWGSLSVIDGKWKTVSILKQFEDKIHWRFIADSRTINWREFLGSELRSHLFKYYTPKNTIYVGIVGLAQNPTFPWDQNLVVEYRELIDRDASVWRALSGNAGFFKSKNFIIEFADKLDFCALSSKKFLEWSEELLGIFPDKDWSWGSISQNEDFPWTDSMLDNYSDKLNWDEIAKNKGVFDGVLKSKINPVVISLLMAEKQ